MAQLRMPPRQKMINMMYLVLTAMLAMNVSKEVLDAFAVLDADLVRSEQAHAGRSALEYAVFDEAAVKFPARFGRQRDQAHAVKAKADSLVAHIEALKRKAIAQAEGTPADSPDSAFTLMGIEHKDDRETLTRMLVGSEPADPRQGPGTAHELKQRIAAFRDSLKALCGSREPGLAASLDLLFDLGDRRDASGIRNNWESMTFYDVPLVAGIASLSKLQADVRSAENDVVKWLYRQVEQDTYKFNTLTAAVVPRSTLVMLGDSFQADVFLAAYDDLNPPEVLLAGGAGEEVLPIGGDGKAKLRLAASQVGAQAHEGVIRFQGPQGMRELPYQVDYQVMAPFLVASPTKMNVLYRGVENPLDLSVPGVPAERVRAVIDNGTVVRQGGGWVVKDLRGPQAKVYAVVEDPDGARRRIGPVHFRVKDLPPPTPEVAGVGPSDTRIKLGRLRAASGIKADLKDTEFNEPWRVLRYRFTLQRGGTPIVKEVQGQGFSAEVQEVLARLRSGDVVHFEGIRARLANGEGPIRDLPSLHFAVVP